MKTTLLLFLLILTIKQDPLNDLIGKWQLVKVETHGKTIPIQKQGYFLNISQKTIKYNLEVNQCWSDSFFVDKTNIILYENACTLICCDGRSDSISEYINYTGTYKLQDSILTIFNNKGALFLKKRN